MDDNESSCMWVLGFNCTDNAKNISELQRPDYFRLYKVPLELMILLSTLYGTISFVAVVGNSLVIWIVATSRRMQSVTNCYIANLALADIVIGLFAIPFQFQAALLQRWNLPYFMCPFCPFVQVLTVNVSIFTLTAIAVDRHRAILNPLRARRSKLRAKISIATIWVSASILATPMAIALRVRQVEEEGPGGTVIMKPFCMNVSFSDRVLFTYRMVLVLVQYVTPLCIISCVYIRMALRLWGSRAPGNAQDSRDANLIKNKKKVIKMLVIVVALFALCWLPLQLYNVLQDLVPAVNAYHYINIIWFCCDWLAMSNSCYNPFIYGIYNENFKREFQLRFPFRKKKWRNMSLRRSGESGELEHTDTIRHNLRFSRYSTTLTTVNNTNHEWLRSYSTRPNAHSITPAEGQANGRRLYRQISMCESPRPKSSENRDLYVYRTNNSCVVSQAKSQAEELCL